jgi:subtilase family serine protease
MRDRTHRTRQLLLSRMGVATLVMSATWSTGIVRAPAEAARSVHEACGPVPAGYARCFAQVAGNAVGIPGLSPGDLQSAYALPSATAGVGQTVAIVDAYDAPNAEADLATYRSQFGLPACTTLSGCFRKVDETGGTSYPKPDTGWGIEISLDLDMVSAICPNCHILLVEATTSNMADLGVAENTAASLGANEISNSWGSNEQSKDTILDSRYFNHPGIAITAATGDSGYGTYYPGTSAEVTAVGGTSLTRANSTRGWAETAWSGASSGCSDYEAQPSWQQANPTITGLCPNRAAADVSAVADPNTGVAYYDTNRAPGWGVVGGTSVASPIIAAVFALAGNASSTTGGSYAYSHLTSHTKANLNDITSGSTGACGNALCNAQAGWDGPTGLGTPNGTGAF